MPSSSLFLRSSTTLISVLSLLSVPTFALTTGRPSSDSLVYQLDKSYEGEDFFDKFNYYSDPDPTHGYVTYVNKADARQMGLASINADGSFRMKVDDETVLTKTEGYYNVNGVGRASVRIEGKDTWTKGLWIADFSHMPGSTCGTWPAYWTLSEGTQWPYGGEIDIIEGVSNRQRALSALHTGEECKITGDSNTMTGELLTTDCNYNSPTPNSNPTGCGVYDRRTDTFGDGFNKNGRVVAMEWTDDAIKMWSWSRGSEPSDIKSGSPLPGSASWGTPAQVFSGPDANIPENFKNHKIIVDTTFCGDFTDAVWAGEGCAASTGYSTCAAFVGGNPSAFKNAYWDINSIKVYQKKAQTSSTSTSTTQGSTSSTSSLTTTLATSTISTSTSHFYGNGTTTSRGSNGSGSTTTRGSDNHAGSTTSSSPTSSTSGSSSWADWIEPKDQKTGHANPVVTGFPMGAGVSGSWRDWTASESVSYITTTITTTYVVPCSTGLETKTATVTTSFAGGKKHTYTPSVPMSTYTTSCPAEWGFGGPVTVTAPATKTVTVYTSAATNGSKHSSSQNNGNGSSNSSDGSKDGSSSSKSNNSNGSQSSSDGSKSNNNASSSSKSNNSNGSQSSSDGSKSNNNASSSSSSNNNNNNNSNGSQSSNSASNSNSNKSNQSSNNAQTDNSNSNNDDWNNWNNGNNAKPASTMTTIATTVTTPAASNTASWSEWNSAAAATNTAVQSSAQATGTGTAAADWSAWNSGAASTSTAAQATGTGTGTAAVAAPADWSAWNNGNSVGSANSNSNVTSPIAKYTGAASGRTSASLMAGFIAMGAALLL